MIKYNKQVLLFLLMVAFQTSCLDSEFVAQDCSGGGSACMIQTAAMVLVSQTQPLVMFVSANTINGNTFANGPSDGDTFCENNKPAGVTGTYKAMIYAAHPTFADRRRVATTVAAANTGQTNWVLQAGKTYTRADGTIIATANENALFDFPLTNSIATSGTFWTGLQTNWVLAAGADCEASGDSWSPGVTAANGNVGDASLKSSSMLVNSSSDCSSVPHALLCVQQ